MEPTNEQRGILPGVPTPEEFDPDLAGWTPGLPQTAMDASAILYTALSQFLGSLPSIFQGAVLGIDPNGDSVIVRFPDGRIWEFRPVAKMAAAFVATEVVDLAGIRPLGDDEQVGK